MLEGYVFKQAIDFVIRGARFLDIIDLRLDRSFLQVAHIRIADFRDGGSDHFVRVIPIVYLFKLDGDRELSGFLRELIGIFQRGETTAEEVKKRIGSATILAKPETMEVKGRDYVTGLPRAMVVTSSEITEAIRPVLNLVVGAAKGVLEETPPELASDIIDKGIVMSGGTSTLRNFDRFMTDLTGVPCHVAEEPLLCVVRGTGIAIENLDLYKKSVTKR
jgi:actin-like ATPase involved in cell morphogenesis